MASGPLSTRLATPADAPAIAAIYNEGIADRVATFETEPRTAAQLEAQLIRQGRALPTVVAGARGPDRGLGLGAAPTGAAAGLRGGGRALGVRGPLGAGLGAGRAALDALCRAYAERGFWKLVSRIFPENVAEPRAARALRLPRGGRLSAPRQARGRLARLRDRGADARRGTLPDDAMRREVVAMCAAQACAQIGAFSVAALIPTLIPAWGAHQYRGRLDQRHLLRRLHPRRAAALVTDRSGGRQAHLSGLGRADRAGLSPASPGRPRGFWSALGFRALMGIGWAGSYMPGLKALSDLTEGPRQSRARGSACRLRRRERRALVRRGGSGERDGSAGAGRWSRARWARRWPSCSCADRPPGPRAASVGGAAPGLLDFRPVLRNRSALAYSLAYCVHTWEMSALRAWVVAFLTFAALRGDGAWVPLAPATVASVMGLVGVWASIWGNELSIRFGRRRFILGTMLVSAAMAAVVGFGAALPYAGTAALVLVYAVLIWSDSSSLTAGSAGSAEPGRRGATLAVHSTLGYAGGFVGPLALGATLDLLGGASVLGWGLAFGHVTLVLIAGAIAFVALRPADLAGDRAAVATPRATMPARVSLKANMLVYREAPPTSPARCATRCSSRRTTTGASSSMRRTCSSCAWPRGPWHRIFIEAGVVVLADSRRAGQSRSGSPPLHADGPGCRPRPRGPAARRCRASRTSRPAASCGSASRATSP